LSVDFTKYEITLDIRYCSGYFETIEVVSDPITTLSQANVETAAESHDQDMYMD
jgi:hypothetical protein